MLLVAFRTRPLSHWCAYPAFGRSKSALFAHILEEKKFTSFALCRFSHPCILFTHQLYKGSVRFTSLRRFEKCVYCTIVLRTVSVQTFHIFHLYVLCDRSFFLQLLVTSSKASNMRPLLRPCSLVNTERTMEGFNCLHGILHVAGWFMRCSGRIQVLGGAVHIANPDLYTNKGKLTGS